MIADLTKRLLERESLSADATASAIGAIMDGEATPVQIAAFLIALRAKGETATEILGAAKAMRARMHRINVRRAPLVDTCGTGGDGQGTFNISTAVAFVIAAAGVAVAKHGNRAVSSRAGSADVLAAAGVNLEASQPVVERCIEEVGLGFLFAPALHPAMRHAAAVRRELGVRTVFNVLGPLTNPAGAAYQLLGVYSGSLCRTLAQVLAELGSARAWVVHGGDGLDELTVCDATQVAEWNGTTLVEHEVTPEQAGLKRHPKGSLAGGSAEENAATLRTLLGGSGPEALRDAVALNAGAVLYLTGKARDLRGGVSDALDLLKRGTPLGVLERLVAMTR